MDSKLDQEHWQIHILHNLTLEIPILKINLALSKFTLKKNKVMANEITQTVNLTVSKNNASSSFSCIKRIDMTGSAITQATQSIGTTAEVLALGDIVTAPGNLAIKNLDSTNYIEIGGDSGLTVFKVKLLAGQSLIFTPTSATIYAKANTAAVLIQALAIEA